MASSFVPESLVVQNADDLKALYQALLDRKIDSVSDFNQLLSDVSDLDSFISEDMAWRYIRMTCDTLNKEHEESYLQFVQHIQPELAPFEDLLNQKLVEQPYWNTKDFDNALAIYYRSLKSAVDLFREANIPLQAELSTLAQEYSATQGAMSIDWQGKEITLQQASNLLLETDPVTRKKAWLLIQERRQLEADKLDALFTKMIGLRHQIALNAGFENYRDYMFVALGRFDYTAQDCKDFHTSIEKNAIPLLKEVHLLRKSQMKTDVLNPWDLQVDPLQRKPLKPFETGDEMRDKGIAVLNDLDPFFAECLQTMKEKSLLDLSSRVGKAPGGYNYPLARTNMPFIFMNATSNLRDVETLLHEAGHAIHSFQMAPLHLNAFKNTPSEVAELASMSMELISMSAWNRYFAEDESLNRAKTEQIEGVIGTLPWIATIDAFQHWIYENPNHTSDERKAEWKQLLKRFGTGMVDHDGYEHFLDYAWQRQLHLFEVPFYYIEYGIAQLGAVGIWRNYMERNAEKALEDYKAFMKLGYTCSMGKIYETAGVKFDFSAAYVKELMDFVGGEWKKGILLT
jgi:oligoendopeptidase F